MPKLILGSRVVRRLTFGVTQTYTRGPDFTLSDTQGRKDMFSRIRNLKITFRLTLWDQYSRRLILDSTEYTSGSHS